MAFLYLTTTSGGANYNGTVFELLATPLPALTFSNAPISTNGGSIVNLAKRACKSQCFSPNASPTILQPSH